MRVVINTSVLQRIAREMPGKAEAIVQKMAQDTQTDIVNNFSPNSPSSPGEPPGVDTGNLKNSVVAVPDNAPLTWRVRVGAEYGAALEYGIAKMAARPYVLPAVERTVNNLPSALAAEVYER